MSEKAQTNNPTDKKPWYKNWLLTSLLAGFVAGIISIPVLPGLNWRFYLLIGVTIFLILMIFNPTTWYRRMFYGVLGSLGLFHSIEYNLQLHGKWGGILVKSPELSLGFIFSITALGLVLLYYDFKQRNPGMGVPVVNIETGDKEKVEVKDSNFEGKTEIAHTITHQGQEQTIQAETISGVVTSGTTTIGTLTINNPSAKQEKSIPKTLTQLPRINLETDCIGRTKDLEKLHSTLQNPNSSKIVLLNGMGGIGKTTLAKAYLQQYRNQYDYVAWVSQLQTDDLPSAFLEDRNLWENLQLVDAPEPPEQKFNRICKALQNLEGKNLLIVDNADKEAKKHLTALPSGNWKVMATSRDNIAGFEEVRLEQLELEDAKKLFISHYPAAEGDPDLEVLLEEIECHTLTTEMLAKTLAKRHGAMNCKGLLEYLQNHLLNEAAIQRDIEIPHWEEIRDMGSVKLYSHLINTFRLQGLGEYEIWLLKQFAALPSEPQPITRLAEWLKIGEEEIEKYENTCSSLAESGWLKATMDKTVQGFQMHRMIREVVLIETRPSWGDVEVLAESINNLLKIDQTIDNPIAKFPWVAYGQALLNIFTILPHPSIFLLSNLAICYRVLGKLDLAEKISESVLQLALEYKDLYYPVISNAQTNLASILKELGEFKKAAELLEEALIQDIKAFGNSDPEIASKLSILGMIYSELGHNLIALQLVERAIFIHSLHFPSHHIFWSIRLNDLGNLYIKLGMIEEAIEVLKASLEILQKNFNEDHPDIASVKSILASALIEYGEYEDALNMVNDTLNSDINNFGENSWRTANSIHKIALIHHKMGKIEMAATMYDLSLKIITSTKGENSPEKAIMHNNISRFKSDIGNLTEAKSHSSFALSIAKKVWGESHPSTKTIQDFYNQLHSL